MAAEVVDNPEKHRFELTVDGAVAVAEYRVENGRIVLTHTKVPPELSGRGIGSKLARGVFEALQASRRSAAAECSFMAEYARRHPEYERVLTG